MGRRSLWLTPPEQRSGVSLDPYCDQYSLACVVYRLLAGDTPETPRHYEFRLAQKTLGSVAALKQARPDLPEWLVDLLEH